MADESVEIELLGISTESREDQRVLSVVESKSRKEYELVAEEDGEPARIVLKDVELESAAESADQDGVGVTGEGAGGAEQRAEGTNAKSETPALEEEEQEECGFCLFMKGGPCGERFSIWQNCVDAAEKSGQDIVEKCAQTTSLLKVCMEMNLDYYGPVLDAERAMEEVASQDENEAADAAGKLSDEVERTQEKDYTDSEGTGKVVEVVGIATVDGRVSEVVNVGVESSN